jgi:hypothetical protein
VQFLFGWTLCVVTGGHPLDLSFIEALREEADRLFSDVLVGVGGRYCSQDEDLLAQVHFGPSLRVFNKRTAARTSYREQILGSKSVRLIMQ